MFSKAGKVFSILRDYDSFNISPESKRDTLVDLNFISRIHIGQKINVRYRFLQNDGIVTRFSRTFYNIDNKENTLTFIDNTVKRAIDILKLYEAELCVTQSLDNQRALISRIKIIIKTLEESKIGMENLQKTYTGHDLFISRLQQVMNDIDTEIEPRIEKYFNGEISSSVEASPMSLGENSQTTYIKKQRSCNMSAAEETPRFGPLLSQLQQDKTTTT